MTDGVLRSLHREGSTEAIQVETWTGQVDGEGKPSYNTPQEISGRVVENVTVTRGPEGESIRFDLLVFVSADQPVEPDEHDRITWPVSGGRAYVVVTVERPRRILHGGIQDHVELMCQEE